MKKIKTPTLSFEKLESVIIHTTAQNYDQIKDEVKQVVSQLGLTDEVLKKVLSAAGVITGSERKDYITIALDGNEERAIEERARRKKYKTS